MSVMIQGLIEEGEAFNRLRESITRTRVDVLVIGGGQAGLSTGYHLQKLGLSFVIVDANTRIGDAWRKRWDSLRLFTPARYDGLDGLPFPAPPNHFPTKTRWRITSSSTPHISSSGANRRENQPALAGRDQVLC
jgi:monoamine oxidase